MSVSALKASLIIHLLIGHNLSLELQIQTAGLRGYVDACILYSILRGELKNAGHSLDFVPVRDITNQSRCLSKGQL